MLEMITKRELWDLFEERGRPITFVELMAHSVASRLTHFEFARLGVIGTATTLQLGDIAVRNDVVELDPGDLRAALADGHGVEAKQIFSAQQNSLDALVSVNFVNGTSHEHLDTFAQINRQLLRPGGLMLHAFEFIVEDVPSAHWMNRYTRLTQLVGGTSFAPMGKIVDHLSFRCDAATMHDYDLFNRKAIAPVMDPLRMRSQTVAMVLAGRRVQSPDM